MAGVPSQPLQLTLSARLCFAHAIGRPVEPEQLVCAGDGLTVVALQQHVGCLMRAELEKCVACGTEAENMVTGA